MPPAALLVDPAPIVARSTTTTSRWPRVVRLLAIEQPIAPAPMMTTSADLGTIRASYGVPLELWGGASRPHGLVVAKRHRGAVPARCRLGQAHDRAEGAQPGRRR